MKHVVIYFFRARQVKQEHQKKQKHSSYDGVSVSLKARDGLHSIYLWKKIYNEP